MQTIYVLHVFIYNLHVYTYICVCYVCIYVYLYMSKTIRSENLDNIILVFLLTVLGIFAYASRFHCIYSV